MLFSELFWEGFYIFSAQWKFFFFNSQLSTLPKVKPVRHFVGWLKTCHFWNDISSGRTSHDYRWSLDLWLNGCRRREVLLRGDRGGKASATSDMPSKWLRMVEFWRAAHLNYTAVKSRLVTGPWDISGRFSIKPAIFKEVVYCKTYPLPANFACCRGPKRHRWNREIWMLLLVLPKKAANLVIVVFRNSLNTASQGSSHGQSIFKCKKLVMFRESGQVWVLCCCLQTVNARKWFTNPACAKSVQFS